MAPYQTTYGGQPAKGLKGQIANEESCNKISRTVENVAGIKFGQPVARGVGDHGVIPLAAGGKFMGFAVLNPAVPPVAPGSTLVDGYPQFFTGAFMLRGQMYHVAGGTVADGDPVYYDTVNDRVVNAAGTGIVGPIPETFFDTSGVAGSVVEISTKNRSA
ncbi:structural cement protein Gp24 [Aureimonas psammosilenae]|uniref:structural cement protein Gp24 n=1 Tax=Aureimonas psammosilenae TaxID=2495496 RepID=UPI001260C833|nr:hypothetical protein [Aureimonas psammosilenae]